MTNPRKMMMAAAGVDTGPTDELFTWGSGRDGRLGHGNTTNLSSPVQLGALKDWGSVSTDMVIYGTTMVVKNDGTLWSWGFNGYGQLGDGSTTSRSSPAQVGSLTDWALCDITNRGCAAVKTDGTLWTWGLGTYGRNAQGNTTHYSSPVQVGSLTNWLTPCGLSHAGGATKTDGTLWTWGRNYQGMLGHSGTTNCSSPIQVGSLTDWGAKLTQGDIQGFCVIKPNGTLWRWGRNYFGTLGNGNTTHISSPIQVGSLTDWVLSSGGQMHQVAIKSDGTAWTWGYNGPNFMLGLVGTGETSYSSPVQIGSLTNWATPGLGYQHTLAVKTDGTLWAWGTNTHGQLGQDNTTGPISSPIQIGSETYWVTPIAGGGTQGQSAAKK